MTESTQGDAIDGVVSRSLVFATLVTRDPIAPVDGRHRSTRPIVLNRNDRSSRIGHRRSEAEGKL